MLSSFFVSLKYTIGHSRFCIADPLFNPRLVNKICASIPELLHYSVQACELEKRIPLLESVIVTGGAIATLNGKKRKKIRESTV